MSAYEDVLYEAKDGVAVIALNRPESLNAFTAAMGQGLKRAVADAVTDKTVRVIVLTGSGRGFCAGADMKLLQKITPGSGGTSVINDAKLNLHAGLGPDVGPHYGGRFGYLMQAPKPIIAALNGPAHALDLLLSARKLGAAEAERIGLVNKVFPQQSFMAEVMAYARALAATVSPRSMAVMKAQVWKGLFQDFNQALALADGEMQKSFASADFKEGVTHYVQKRAPAFTGA